VISVLYVDDEQGLLDIGKIFLEETGDFRVDLMESATAALEHLKTHRYDAIISDYQMPDMDGLAFLREVRKEYGNIPFILFTGRGREDVVILALNNGADFYIQKGGAPKPQFAELAHKVRLSVQRRQAVVALAESERRYRDVVETQTEFICRFLPDGTHVFVNEAYCRYFGKQREEIVGHRFVPGTLPEDRELIHRHIRSLSREHPVAEIEHRVILPDGQIRWQWWSDRAIFDDQGRVAEYQSAGKDITDRKTAEEALKVSEDLYRTIFNTTGAATIITAHNTTILLANAGWETLTGVVREQQENRMSWTVFIDPDDVERLKQYHYARRNDPSSAPGVYECRMIGGDTSVRYCIVNVRMIPGTTNSVVSLVDITARRKAEDELRATYEQLTATEEELRAQYEELDHSQKKIQESERNYRSIIENLQDAFYRTDKEGNIILVSPSFVRAMGYDSIDEIIGKNVAGSFYYHPSDRDEFFRQISASRELKGYRLALKKRDGSKMEVTATSHIYYDEMDRPAGVEGLLHILEENEMRCGPTDSPEGTA